MSAADTLRFDPWGKESEAPEPDTAWHLAVPPDHDDSVPLPDQDYDVAGPNDEPEAGAAAGTDSAATEPFGNSWRPIDLTKVVEGLLNGTLTGPTPTIGRLPDGTCLFYAARVNGIHGDSTAAKTFTALATCRQQLQ